jgi:hypothetical protein
MTFSFFRTIRTHLLLLVLISTLPALGIIIYSGFQQRSQAVNTAKSDALQALLMFTAKKAEERHSISIFLPRRKK